MTKIAYPSLSSSGYITDPKKRLSRMFADAVLMRHNDTNLYQATEASIPELVLKYGQRPGDFTSALQNMLRTYCSPCFDSVTVSVNYDDTGDEIAYSVTIDFQATHDGKSFTLSEVLFVNPDDKTAKLVNQMQE